MHMDGIIFLSLFFSFSSPSWWILGHDYWKIRGGRGMLGSSVWTLVSGFLITISG